MALAQGDVYFTIIGAGGLGLGVIVKPDAIRSMFGWPAQDPVVFGVFGSVYIAFALLSILGLRSPVKFSPVLLFQLCYKAVWFIGLFIPLLAAGRFPAYALVHVVIFASYIIGDLVAIPFPYIFAKQAKSWDQVQSMRI